MQADEVTGLMAQDALPEFPSAQEAVLAPYAVKRMGAANIARAAADLELSLAFCSITEDCVTREHLIRKAAYLRAESRSFVPGGEVDDWVRAEHQVDHWLGIYGLPHHFASDPAILASV
jgi:Protein of unknown function (DUF2934)